MPQVLLTVRGHEPALPGRISGRCRLSHFTVKPSGDLVPSVPWSVVPSAHHLL